MSSNCNGSHPEYPSYKCYEYLSRMLDNPKLSPENEINLQNALNTLEKDKNKEFFKPEIINNLAARIAGDGVFYYSSNTKIACNYINYKLNDSLRSHFNHIYTDDYNIFKKFIGEFYKKRHNNDDPNRSCENYIRYLDKDVYDRMKILYQIYDYYNELKNKAYFVEYNDIDRYCSNLFSLVRYSNYAINEKIINEDTISLIRNLKEIIKKDNENEKYKKVCDKKLLDTMLTEFPKPKVQSSREQRPALVSNVAPITRQPQELEVQKEDAENEEALSQIASNQDSERELTLMNETAMEQASQELEDTDQESGIEVKSFQALMYPAKSQQLPYDQEVKERSGRRYISQDPEAPTRGTEGVLVKMQGFITDTFGSVEPAPILGVSGGMGALFLLFKYTPVGTFFRGRGRVRRIPSGFHGPFPGDFANFQEYDGGFIGYSPMSVNHLAE